MENTLGQDEFRRATTHLFHEEGEVVPEGWEMLIDSGWRVIVHCSFTMLTLVLSVAGISTPEIRYINHDRRRVMSSRPNTAEGPRNGRIPDIRNQDGSDWDTGRFDLRLIGFSF